MQILPDTPLDWELLLKVLTVVVAAIVAIIHARSLHLTSRASIKTDLEILRLLDEANPNREAVKRVVDKKLGRAYPTPRPRATLGRLVRAIPGFIILVVASYWTFLLLRPGFTWWVLLSGYFVFAGLMFTFGPFMPPDSGRKVKDSHGREWTCIQTARGRVGRRGRDTPFTAGIRCELTGSDQIIRFLAPLNWRYLPDETMRELVDTELRKHEK